MAPGAARAVLALALAQPSSALPHIVVHVVDDAGWSDFGFGGAEYPTPSIDAYAANGTVLTQFYTQAVCSPTRAALLTARYPFRFGLQTAIPHAALAAIPLSSPTIAEELRGAGYSTHYLGKWHVGYASWNNTPTGRGFDTSVGYFQGEEDYYSKRYCTSTCVLNGTEGTCGLDFFRGRTAPNASDCGPDCSVYSSSIYQNEAVKLVAAHAGGAAAAQPLFLYVGWQAVHVPLEGPPERGAASGGVDYTRAVANCAAVVNFRRRIYCQMLGAVDAAVGAVHDALGAAGMAENSLVVVSTDNGGMPAFTGPTGLFCDSAGSNAPLRAGKATLFEGGVRARALISGGALPAAARGTTYAGLMHAVDLMPTLLQAAGRALPGGRYADGHGIWCALGGAARGGAEEPRVEIPHNIGTNGTANTALRYGDLKLIVKPALRYDGYYAYDNVTVHWTPPPKGGKDKHQLYNVSADPTEQHDLAAQMPEAVAALLDRVQAYVNGSRGDYSNGADYSTHKEGFPDQHGGVWAPWVS